MEKLNELFDRVLFWTYVVAYSIVGLMFVVLVAYLWRLWRDTKHQPSRMVNPKAGRVLYVIGKLGSGKTAFAVARAVRLSKRYNLPVYANARLRPDDPNWHYIADWEALRDLPLGVHRNHPGHPAIILLDEVHLWCTSETGLQNKAQLRLALQLLSFARKRGWYVMATSQAEKRVHSSFRQLVTEYVKVRPLMPGLLHMSQLFDIDTGKRKLLIDSVYRPLKAKYDTNAEVEPLWEIGGVSVSDAGGAPPEQRTSTVVSAKPPVDVFARGRRSAPVQSSSSVAPVVAAAVTAAVVSDPPCDLDSFVASFFD